MRPRRQEGLLLPTIGALILALFGASAIYALVQGKVGSAITALVVVAVLVAVGTLIAALTGRRR
jgi:hypothetical protein